MDSMRNGDPGAPISNVLARKKLTCLVMLPRHHALSAGMGPQPRSAARPCSACAPWLPGHVPAVWTGIPAVWTGCPAVPRLLWARGHASFAVPPSSYAPIHEQVWRLQYVPVLYAAAWAVSPAAPSTASWRSRYSCGPTPPYCQEAAPQGSWCVGRPAAGAALGGDGAGSLGGARTARVPILTDCLSRLCLAKLLLIALCHSCAREPANPASAWAVSFCPGSFHSGAAHAEHRRGLWLFCILEHLCGCGAKSDG